MTPRVNETAPRNESTVMIAIKDSASWDVDTASLCGAGGDVGDDACCELEFDCALCVDEVDVVLRDGSVVTDVTDIVTVVVGRTAGGVTVAGLATLCEVVVMSGAAGTTGEGERVTTGGGMRLATGGGMRLATGGGRRLATGGTGKVTIGVSDDAGGINGPWGVGKTEGLVSAVVTDVGTAGGEDGEVSGSVSDDAEVVTREDPPSVGEHEEQMLSNVVTDGETAGAKDRAVTEGISDDAENVVGDGPSGIGEDRGRLVSAVVTEG